jgi:hypothetical protein
VIKTPLDVCPWPDLMDGPHNRLFAIHGQITRIQAMLFELAKPRQGVFIPLFLRIDMRDDYLASGIHKTDQTAIFMKIGPIINQILEARDIKQLRRAAIKPVMNDASNFRSAVPRSNDELSYRITFLNPKLKPGLLPIYLVVGFVPDVGFQAPVAPISLPVLPCSPISLDVWR